MATHTIKLSDEGYAKLKKLADDLNVLRRMNLDETDADDWFVDVLVKISMEYIFHEKINAYKRKLAREMNDQ